MNATLRLVEKADDLVGGCPQIGLICNGRRKVSVVAVLALSVLLPACEDIGPEARRQALHLPPVGFKGDADQGVALFQKYCMSCHGQNGSGTDQAPPLVHQTYRPGNHADLTFHFAVRDGVKSHHWSFGDMRPVPGITPEDTEHVIAYIRQAQRKPGIQ